MLLPIAVNVVNLGITLGTELITTTHDDKTDDIIGMEINGLLY